MAGVQVSIGADSSKASRELSSFQKKTNKIAASISKGFSERIGHKMFDGLTSAASRIPDFFKAAVDSASSLNEEIGKSQAVFGASASKIEKWSKTTSDAFGISSLQALQATGTMGNMLKAFDVSGEKASEMSMALVELAADMGSFNEASVEDTLFAISAALRGENEPIRKYGVALDDARLKAQALEMGLYSGKGALDANAKAMASYALIIKQTEIQQGNFADTADDLANSKKRLVARFKDFQAEVGKSLLPTVKELINKLKELDFEKIAQKVSKVIDALIKLAPLIIKVGLAIKGIQIASFFASMISGLTKTIALWGAETAAVNANTAAKLRNASAGGAAAAASGGGAVAGAAGGVLSKFIPALLAVGTALVGFKAGEFIGEGLTPFVPEGPMGFPGSPKALSDRQKEKELKAAAQKEQEAVDKSNSEFRKKLKEEEDRGNRIRAAKDEEARRKGIINRIRDEYKNTLKVLDARIKGDKEFLEQEELKKEVAEEQKKSALDGFSLDKDSAMKIVLKRREAEEAEKSRAAEKESLANRAEQAQKEKEDQFKNAESDFNNAMGRSSNIAVSSLQRVGGGGGVYGELDLQRRQTDLQTKMVSLLEDLKSGANATPLSDF